MPMRRRTETPRRAVAAMIAPCVRPPLCFRFTHSVLSIMTCVHMVSIWRMQ
jgi:hypothetical protein